MNKKQFHIKYDYIKDLYFRAYNIKEYAEDYLGLQATESSITNETMGVITSFNGVDVVYDVREKRYSVSKRGKFNVIMAWNKNSLIKAINKKMEG